MSERTQRRLAAIMAADVVGYSRLVDENELATLEALRQVRSELLEPAVAEYRGNVIKRMGDGWLIEFGSVLDAVSCAVHLQRQLAEHEAIQLRIGLHIGDITYEGEDIYGGGVNIAARLESIAEAGGICISAKVYDEVKRKLDIEFVDGGEQKLKNIHDAVRVYHCRFGNGRAPVSAGGHARSAVGDPEKIRIAVKPLQAIGNGAELTTLAQGLGSGIADGLTRSTSLDVTSGENENADFILEGTARSIGQRIRVSFSLSEVAKATQIWSERYDRTMDDVFDLEDEIAQTVAYTVRLSLIDAGHRRLKGRDDADLSGPDLLTKAAGYASRGHKDIDKAADAVEMALAKMPDSSMAHAMKAAALFIKAEFRPMALEPEVSRDISFHIDKALALDGAGFFEHLIKAIELGDIHQDLAASKMHAELALNINPQLAPARVMVAVADCQMGDSRDAMDKLQQLIKADRLGPHRHRHGRELAICLLLAGREQQAADVMRRVTAQAPELRRNDLALAAALGLSGDNDAATRVVSDLLKSFPKLTSTTMRPTTIANAELGERFVAALRNAGLPGE